MPTQERRTSTAKTDNGAGAGAFAPGNCLRELPVRYAKSRIPAVPRVLSEAYGASPVPFPRPRYRHRRKQLAGCLAPGLGRSRNIRPERNFLAQHLTRTAKAQTFLRRWRQSVVRWHRMLQGRLTEPREAASSWTPHRVQIWTSCLTISNWTNFRPQPWTAPRSSQRMDRCSDTKQQMQAERSQSLQICRRYRKVNFATRASGVLTSRYPSVDPTLGEFVRFPMTSRTRFLITAAFVCHLLLTPSLVTSQLRSPASASNTAQDLPNTPSAPREEDVTITAISQEKIGRIYKLHGKAEIHYGVYILHGDEVTYNADTGDSTADGHVVLEGGPNDEHIEASHGTYNVRAETGRFENVTGSIGVQMRANRLMLTSTNPFFFTGKVVEKTAPEHYTVYDGTVTTCELPHPRWQFNANKVVVDVGGTAKIYHSLFGLKGIPVLYFPFATLPAQRFPRQTGFLIPNVGTSSVKGTILGESLFWAINRSMDAHIGAEYFSARGWAPQAEFRAQPSSTSFLDLNYFAVLDRGVGNPPVNQGGEEARLNGEGEFGHNFRGVANVDYLSSYVFRLAFNDVFAQAVDSEVKSKAFLSNTTDGFFYNVSTQRYQDFESTTAGDVVTILHAPSFEVSSVDRQLGPSSFYWSYEAAAEGLSRSEPGFSTAALVGRFDFEPTVSLPLKLDGWSFRPEFSLRDTEYTQQLGTSSSGARVAESDPINRWAAEGSVEVRPPALSRIFDREFIGRKWKH